MPRQRVGESDEDFRHRACEYMKERYQRRRNLAVEQLGSKCIDCGGTTDLEFDHANAADKRASVGKLFASASEIKLQAELSKCVLRCADCHKEKSKREADVPLVGHGQGKTGKKNCYCNLCAPLKRRYNANRRMAVRRGAWQPTYDRPHIKPL